MSNIALTKTSGKNIHYEDSIVEKEESFGSNERWVLAYYDVVKNIKTNYREIGRADKERYIASSFLAMHRIHSDTSRFLTRDKFFLTHLKIH